MFSSELDRTYKIIASGHPALIGLTGTCMAARGPRDDRRLDLLIHKAGSHMVAAYGLRMDDVRPV